MANFTEISFRAGLNSKADHITCPPGSCLTFSDYQLNYGVLTPRASIRPVTSTVAVFSNQVDGCFYWVDDSLVPNAGYIYAGSNGRLFRTTTQYQPTNDGHYLFEDITSTSSSVTVAASSWSALNGNLLFVGNGSNVNYISSHGASPVMVSSIPVGTGGFLKSVNNFMFYSGVWISSSNYVGSNVYWSNVGDPLTWSALNYVSFRPRDGDIITALGELYGNLLIFKRNSIGMLSTSTMVISGAVTLGPLTTLYEGIGTLGPDCVDNLPDGRCVFIGTDRNVYIYDGAVLQPISDNPPPGTSIRNLLLSVNTPGGSPTQCGIRLKYFPQRNEIVIVVSEVDYTNPIVVAYDIYQKYWRRITGITPVSMALVTPVVDNYYGGSALLIGTKNGNIFDFSLTDNYMPNNEVTSFVSPVVETSVPFPATQINSQMLCVTILYSGTAHYDYGFDGTYGNGGNTLPAGNTRADLKIPITLNSNHQRPTTFQIKFESIAAPGLIHNVYIGPVMEA
jgi:hypothetical protein